MKVTEWRRMNIPSFGDSKQIGAGLTFLNEIPFTASEQLYTFLTRLYVN